MVLLLGKDAFEHPEVFGDLDGAEQVRFGGTGLDRLRDHPAGLLDLLEDGSAVRPQSGVHFEHAADDVGELVGVDARDPGVLAAG